MRTHRARHPRALAIATAAIAIVAVLGACGGDDEDSAGATQQETSAAEVVDVRFEDSPEEGLPTAYPEPRPEKLTIGFLVPTRATEVLQVLFDSARKEVELLGGSVIEHDANLNPDKQVSQFEQLLNQGVDGIGMYAIAGPNVLGPLLKKAAEAGVPVIGFDVTPGVPEPVPGFASQIWQQRDRMTYLQVKAAAEALPPGSEIGLIGLGLPVPLFQYAAERQRYWAKQFGLEVVDQVDSKNDTTTGGEQAATGMLAEHPDMAGVLGYNDEPAIGASLAARAAGRPDVKTFGVTAGTLGRSSIENGRLTASVAVGAVEMGHALALGLYDAAQGTKIPPVVVAGDPYLVTAENVDATSGSGGG